MKKCFMLVVAVLFIGGLAYADEVWKIDDPKKQTGSFLANNATHGDITGGNILMDIDDNGGWAGYWGGSATGLVYPYPGGVNHSWSSYFIVGQQLETIPPDAYEGMYALTDSPGGPYPNGYDGKATINMCFDFSSVVNPQLSFYHHYDIESGWDYGYVEAATDLGGVEGYFDDSPGIVYDDNGYPGESSAIYTGTGIDLTGTNPVLTVAYKGDFEGSTSYWDGFIVEVSNDGGSSWTQVDADNSDGNYDDILSTGFANPLGGLWAFCYDYPSDRIVTFDLSEFGSYTNAQFRFHLGWDDWYAPSDGVKINYYEVTDDSGSVFFDDCDSTANYTMEMTWDTITEGAGGDWTALTVYSGLLDTYTLETVDLSGYIGEPMVYLRFRLVTDSSVQYDGWYIDNVSVDCATNLFFDGFEAGLDDWIIEGLWGTTVSTSIAYVADYYDTANTTMVQGEWYATSPLTQLGSGPGDDNWYAQFDDSAAAVPAGGFPIMVDKYAYAWNSAPNDDYVVLEYCIKNTGADDLGGIYVGHSANFRMNNYSFDDYYDYSYDGDMIFSYDDTSDYRGGLKLIGHGYNNGPMFPDLPTSANFSSDWGGDGGMFDAMANGEFDGETVAQDGHAITGLGPFTIPAGCCLKVAYAVVMGDNYDDMVNNANAAVNNYLGLNSSACIDFDAYPCDLAEIPTGAQIDNAWASWGVMMSGVSLNSGYMGVYTGRPGDHPDVVDNNPLTAPNFCKTMEYQGDISSDAGEITFTLVDPDTGDAWTASHVSIWFLDVELPGSKLEVFDLNGNLLGLVNIPAGPDGNQFLAQIGAAGIHKVVATVGVPDPGGESASLDDFCFIRDLQPVHRPPFEKPRMRGNNIGNNKKGGFTNF